MIISLIGYRGCGKSTVANELARRTGLPAFDADRELERLAGRTIPEIFQDDGESVFRQWEARTLRQLYCVDQCIIATGGGAILNPHSRLLMRHRGPVVWLTADIETIFCRLQRDTTTGQARPALTQQSLKDEIRSVLAARTNLYRQTSDFQIDTARRSPAALAEELLRQISALPSARRSTGRDVR